MLSRPLEDIRISSNTLKPIPDSRGAISSSRVNRSMKKPLIGSLTEVRANN